jgi:hypothetical protein
MTAAQRAWADLRQAAADSIKLGLAERRARIEDDQVELVTRALNAVCRPPGWAWKVSNGPGRPCAAH